MEPKTPATPSNPAVIVEKDSQEEDNSKELEGGTSITQKSMNLTIEEDRKDKEEEELKKSFKASLKRSISKHQSSTMMSKKGDGNHKRSQDYRVDDINERICIAEERLD